MDGSAYIDLLRNRFPEALFRHSMGVAQTAEELAGRWNADRAKARLAGIVHDYAKVFSMDELLSKAEKLNLPLDDISRAEKGLLHAPVGAALLSTELGITDREVLRAVAYHTTGHSRMTLLEKIVYLALISPNSTFFFFLLLFPCSSSLPLTSCCGKT